MELSKKRQIFSGFFSAFLKCRENFEHFQKKKMTFIENVFLNLHTPRSVIR